MAKARKRRGRSRTGKPTGKASKMYPRQGARIRKSGYNKPR